MATKAVEGPGSQSYACLGLRTSLPLWGQHAADNPGLCGHCPVSGIKVKAVCTTGSEGSIALCGWHPPVQTPWGLTTALWYPACTALASSLANTSDVPGDKPQAQYPAHQRHLGNALRDASAVIHEKARQLRVLCHQIPQRQLALSGNQSDAKRKRQEETVTFVWDLFTSCSRFRSGGKKKN
ncbi:hypothetical protein MG293_006825 [Ovis ammon polii]|uniref:Uncharacterized protein n=1 Tax=Ovis ammon polii TaxID=230172 RepID=A0AAD4UDG9_OVIAM|nr:hypothetical protein MG293_006825 [Ovis ammon polii]KAI4572170.1 hypothetical protein MJT46_005238 [Ovis ammon polii x Ovis aries]